MDEDKSGALVDTNWVLSQTLVTTVNIGGPPARSLACASCGRNDDVFPDEYLYTRPHTRVTIPSPSRGVVPLQTDSPGAAPPDAFGPFRVLHQVGAGALGPVFRAFDPEGDRLVAVKVFELGLPPDRMHQLVSGIERLIAVDLRHAVILAPIAAGTDGIVVYAAQAFAAGDSLDVVIRDRGPVPPEDALAVAAQLAGALDFAAVVDVNHGTLHPRDVLFAEDGVQLTGLGVARILERLGASPPVRRPYTAPERVAGTPWDRRADVFSLAALIYEMLWGRRVAGLGGEAARSLTALPGGHLPLLRSTFARALAEQPSDRFDTALDFAVALKTAFPDVAIAPASSADGRHDEPPLKTRQGGERLPFDEGRHAEVPSPQLPVSNLQSPVASPQSPVDRPQAPVDSLQPSVDTDRSADVPQLEAASPVSTVSDDDLPLDVGQGRQEVPARVDMPLRDAPVDQRAATPPMTVSDGVWDSKISQPSLKWIERETAPVVHDESLLFGAQSDDSSSRRPLWPIGVALVAGLAVGFVSGYVAGGRQQSVSSVVAAVPAAPASPPVTPQPPATSQRSAIPQPSAAPPSAGRASKEPIAAPAPAKATPSSASARTAPAKAAVVDAGWLVRSVPADAAVFVDGVERGRTPTTIRDLKPGAHRIRIVRDGYVTQNRRVDIAAGRKPRPLTLTLQRARGAPAGRAAAPTTQGARETVGALAGELEVQSRPPGAKVFLDGKLVGTTPMTAMASPVGEHSLRLEHEGYRRWTSSIRVVSGQRNRITASLER